VCYSVIAARLLGNIVAEFGVRDARGAK